MTGKKIIFTDEKINKSNFYKNKKLFHIDDIDVNKTLSSKKESYGTKIWLKYINGYNDDGVIRPLCIKLPQMIEYVKCFESNKTMSFKVIDNKLLKKYTEIWERVSSLMKIKFVSEPVYGEYDKYIKTKIKLYGDKLNINFQGEKVPKENASYKCFSMIMLDSVIGVNKKYYPQTLLEECKYEIKKKKMKNFINDNLDLSLSDNETDSVSDNEVDNESDNGSNE